MARNLLSTPRPRIAVLHNPAATGNRGKPPPTLPPNARLMVLDGLGALGDQLDMLATEGCDLLVVDGGDGTVREVVSRLPEIFTDPPVIGIIAHGNTNLIARKLGRVPDTISLTDLTFDAVTRSTRAAPVLRIDQPGNITMRGFIAGWGAYATGTRIAVAEIESRGQQQVVRAVLTTLRRALIGAEAQAIRRGVATSITASGADLPRGPRLLGIVTVLPGALIAGMAPFWGTGTGNLRWLDVTAPPRRLWLGAPLALIGRPMKWMADAGYRSARSETLELRVAGGIVLDGELIETDETHDLRISASETVRILSL